MNYIERTTQALLAELPKLDSDLAGLYVLLILIKGIDTTLEDVHDAWSVWRSKTRPDHKSIVWFYMLTFEVQELDRKYMEAIHKVARKVSKI